MAGDVQPDRQRARLQARLGRSPLQRQIRDLAEVGRPRGTSPANDRSAPLGQIASHRLRQSEASIMTKPKHKPKYKQYIRHFRDMLESPARRAIGRLGLKILERLEI